MDQELELLELKLKSQGFKNVEDFIRKNIHRLSEKHLRLLELIGFDFKKE
jgi:hypothetical protein